LIGYIDNADPNAEFEVLDVETINGQSVHDFIIDLANNPAVFLPHQSVGGRVNALMRANAVFAGLFVIGRPTDVLPDTFEVTYVGGGSNMFITGCYAPTYETWFTTETVDQDLVLKFNREVAEAFVNQPGEQFDAYLRAVIAVDDVISDGGGSNSTRRNKRSLQERWGKDGPKKPVSKELREYNNSRRRKKRSLQQEQIWEEHDGISDAFPLDDDVIVIKLQSFMLEPSEFASLWASVVSFAAENGQTKLIFDLSTNGGGDIETAYTTLFLLFPEVPIEWFENQWDMNFNAPMQEYFEGLIPLLNTIADNFDDLSDQVSVPASRSKGKILVALL